MTQQQQQQDDPQSVLSYARHQASKSLADLAALMRRTAQDWSRCLEDVSEEQAAFKAGDWCIKDAVAHLLFTTDSVNAGIKSLVHGTPRPADPGVGTVPEWDRSFGEDLRPASVAVWEETAALALSLPEDGPADSSFAHPWFGPLHFREWIAFQRIHAMDHIRQIETIKTDPGYPRA